MNEQTINQNNPLAVKVTKTAEGLPPTIISQNIVIRPVNRQPMDIANWRTATRSAESQIPRRVLLYDMYEEVMLDGHVGSCIEKREEPVTTAQWEFVDKEGKPIDEINDIIDSVTFEELLKVILGSKFWGYSMIEFGFHKDFEGKIQLSVFDVPKKHMRPDKGVIAYEQSGDDGINIREGIYTSTVMEVGKSKDLGLLIRAAQYAILKRGGVGDWAMFVQTFGQPILDATWDGFDEEQRIKLLEALDGMGAGGQIVRPKGTEIQAIAPPANADGKLQDTFTAFLNKEISKALLGNTETTESSQSSGYAQSQTHKKGEEKKNESDATFVRRILNSKFRKILKDNGIDTKGGRFIIRSSEEQLTKKDKFALAKQMREMGIPVDDDQFYEISGIDKPDDYDAQKARMQAEKDMLDDDDLGVDDDTEEGNNARTPKAVKGKAAPKAASKQQKSRAMSKFFDALSDFFA